MSTPVQKAIAAAAGTLTRELGRDCRPVFFMLDFTGNLKLVWPDKKPPKLTPAAEELIAVCLKKERTIVIASRADPLLAHLGPGDFNSALAVPLLDSDKNAVGVIYTQHGIPDLFTPEQRLLVERNAWSLARVLPKKGVAKQRVKPPEEARSSWSLRAVVLTALLCVAGATAWFMAPESKPMQPDVTTVQLKRDLAADPAAVVSAFRSSLGLRRFSDAYAMLHPDLQQSLTAQQFESQVSEWLKVANNRWELPTRAVQTGPTQPGRMTCLLQPVQGGSDTSVWEWTLVPEGDQLRIVEMRGGPLS